MNKKIEYILNKIIFYWICILSFLIAVAFYLRTYDSCQIKLALLQSGGVLIVGLWMIKLAIAERIQISARKQKIIIILVPLLFWGSVSFLLTDYKYNWDLYKDEFLLCDGRVEVPLEDLRKERADETDDMVSLFWLSRSDSIADYINKYNSPILTLIKKTRKKVDISNISVDKNKIKKYIKEIKYYNDEEILLYYAEAVVSNKYFQWENSVFKISGVPNLGVKDLRKELNVGINPEAYLDQIKERKLWIVQRAMVFNAKSIYQEQEMGQFIYLVLSSEKMHPWVKAAVFEIVPVINKRIVKQAVNAMKSDDILLRVNAMRFLGFQGKSKEGLDLAIKIMNKSRSIMEREEAKKLVMLSLPDDKAVEAIIRRAKMDISKKTEIGGTILESDFANNFERDNWKHPKLLVAFLSLPKVINGNYFQSRLKDKLIDNIKEKGWVKEFYSLTKSPFKEVMKLGHEIVGSAGNEAEDRDKLMDEAIRNLFYSKTKDEVESASEMLLKEGSFREAEIIAGKVISNETLNSPATIISILSKLGGEKAAGAIILFIKQNRTFERYQAIIGLRQVADVSAELKNEIKILLENIAFVEDKDINYRSEALESLIYYTKRDKEYRERLLRRVASMPERFGRGEISIFARQGFSQYVVDIDTWNPLPVLYELLEDKNAETRRIIAGVLSTIGDRQSIEELKKFIEDENIKTKSMVWYAIIKISERFNIKADLPVEKNNLDWLRKALFSEDHIIREKIIDILVYLKSDIGIEWVEDYIMRSEFNRMLDKEIKYLGILNTEQANKQLYIIAIGNCIDSTRITALEEIRQDNMDLYEKALSTILISEHKITQNNRDFILYILESINSEKLYELGQLLIPYLLSMDEKVSNEATSSLLHIEFDGKGRKLLEIYHRSKDNQNLSKKIIVVAHAMADEEEKELVLEALNDDRPEIREIAWGTLSDNAKNNEWSFNKLREMLQAEDNNIKKKASNIIRYIKKKNLLTPQEKEIMESLE